jgi:hypothetical protein
MGLLDIHHFLVQCRWYTYQMAWSQYFLDCKSSLPYGMRIATDKYSLVSVSILDHWSQMIYLMYEALWDGLLCNFFGFVIVGCLMALNGRAGSVYHVSLSCFP